MRLIGTETMIMMIGFGKAKTITRAIFMKATMATIETTEIIDTTGTIGTIGTTEETTETIAASIVISGAIEEAAEICIISIVGIREGEKVFIAI